MAVKQAIWIGSFLLLAWSSECFSTKCPGERTSVESLVFAATNVLKSKGFPFWAASLDPINGTYNLDWTNDVGNREGTQTVVSQAKLIWAFSFAHNLGYSSPSRDYIYSAKSGFRFLQENFHDSVNGGYYWSTDNAGVVQDDRKFLEGQMMVVNALVEYSEAAGDISALNLANALLTLVIEKAEDIRTDLGGFLEYFTKDWTLIENGSGPMGLHAWKTAHNILIMADAVTNLFTHNSSLTVQSFLQDIIEHSEEFFPEDPAGIADQLALDGTKPGTFPTRSYGQIISWAWIRAEAEHALDQGPNWKRFDAYVQYALEMGTDPSSNGLLNEGKLVPWPQLEVIRMVVTEMKYRKAPKYEQSLENALRFFLCRVVDNDNGPPSQDVDQDGSPRNITKESNWTNGFHVARALGSLSNIPSSNWTSYLSNFHDF